MEKVYVVAPDHYGVSDMWKDAGYEIVADPDTARIICFTGGADISPTLYDTQVHPSVYDDKRRDEMEIPYYDRFKSVEKLKVGICRGAQLLCVLNGGKLYQDVNNHGRTHTVWYKDEDGNRTSEVTSSVHHQMMFPGMYTRCEAWGVANEATYRDFGVRERRAVDTDEGPDLEIAYFPETASFCFQGHPEFGPPACVDIFHRAVTRALTRQQRTWDSELAYKASLAKRKKQPAEPIAGFAAAGFNYQQWNWNDGPLAQAVDVVVDDVQEGEPR